MEILGQKNDRISKSAKGTAKVKTYLFFPFLTSGLHSCSNPDSNLDFENRNFVWNSDQISDFQNRDFPKFFGPKMFEDFFSTKINFPRKIFFFIENFCIRRVIRNCFSLCPGDLKLSKLLFVANTFLKMWRVRVNYNTLLENRTFKGGVPDGSRSSARGPTGRAGMGSSIHNWKAGILGAQQSET